jgi:hypothetical protein
MKVCKSCGSKMPEKRVQLGYSECTKCSTTESYGFVNIINHKTGNTVQPMPKKQADAINKIGERKRFGTVLKGGSKTNTYNPKNIKFGASLVQIGSPQSFEKVGVEAQYLCETKGFDTASLYVDKEVKDYTISATQAFQIKQLLRILNN